MKTSFKNVTVLAISISMVVMLLSSSATHAQNSPKFAYDKKENSETVFTIDETGKYLTPKIKYEFDKDANGVVTAKKAYRWNAAKAEWNNYYIISYTAVDNDTILEFAQWDEKTGTYTQNRQKAVYNRDATNQLFACHVYNWNSSVGTWDLSKQLIAQNYFAVNNMLE